MNKRKRNIIIASVVVLAIAALIFWVFRPPFNTYTQPGDTVERVKDAAEIAERLDVPLDDREWGGDVGGARYDIINGDMGQWISRVGVFNCEMYVMRVKKSSEQISLFTVPESAELEYEFYGNIGENALCNSFRYLDSETGRYVIIEDIYLPEWQLQFSMYIDAPEFPVRGVTNTRRYLEDCSYYMVDTIVGNGEWP